MASEYELSDGDILPTEPASRATSATAQARTAGRAPPGAPGAPPPAPGPAGTTFDTFDKIFFEKGTAIESGVVALPDEPSRVRKNRFALPGRGWRPGALTIGA